MKRAGIYLHIPFCKSRCSYCDFATDVYKSADVVERYVDALIAEVENSELGVPTKPVFDTIYFGGGTPSLMSAKQVEKILDSICEKFEIVEHAEITLEMNPATVSLETLKDYKSLGVNRASFGVQTFNNRSLKILARGHDADDARNTFEILKRAGFDNISFDLIGGLPNQTLEDWENNLDEALQLDPEHISLYLLEIVEGTPLFEQIRSKRQPLPDEDLAGEMYDLMLNKVLAKGFKQYEISSFAKPGFKSRHNSKYWKLHPVYGFGCSAHSFDGVNSRWSNERDAPKYVTLIESGKTPIVEMNKLTNKQVSGEFAFLGLRLAKGLNLSEFEKQFGINIRNEFGAELDKVRKLGLVEFENDHLKLTRKGNIYSNEVFEIFI